MKLLRDMLSCISYIHSNNIIHRDISPSNIIYENGSFYLCDFGYAVLNESKRLSICVGTKGFKAPEINKLGMKNLIVIITRNLFFPFLISYYSFPFLIC